MPRFLFYTHEGFTLTPYVLNEYEEYEGGNDTENLQVIGFAEGSDFEEAFDRLLSDNPYLIHTTFDEIIAIELKEQEHKTFGFSLNSIREQQEAK